MAGCLNSNKYADVVVGIIASTPVSQPVDGGDPIIQTVVQKSQGTLGEYGLIICPASAVLIPPSVSSVALPLYADSLTVDGRIKNSYFPHSSIIVTVNGMASGLLSYPRQAYIVGLCGSSDVAVLSFIDDNVGWNNGTGSVVGNAVDCNDRIQPCGKVCDIGCPEVKKFPRHPWARFFFDQCEAREYCPDNCCKVNIPSLIMTTNSGVLGFDSGTAVCLKGRLLRHSYTDGSGWYLPQAVLVQASLPIARYGQPVLDKDGIMMGMLTASYNNGFSASSGEAHAGLYIGPNWMTICRVVQAILYAITSCDGSSSPNYTDAVLYYSESSYGFYALRVPYLGIAYKAFEGDSNLQYDFTSGAPLGGTLIADANNPSNNTDGPILKNITGLTLKGIAGANPDNVTATPNGQFYVLGGVSTAPLVEGTADIQGPIPDAVDGVDYGDEGLVGISAILNKIPVGSIITHVSIKGKNESYPLGLRPCEYNLYSFLTQTARVGHEITLTYRPGNGVDDTATSYQSVSVKLADAPPATQYPWYTIQQYDFLSTLFTFPAGQIYPENPSGPGHIYPQRNLPADNGYFVQSI